MQVRIILLSISTLLTFILSSSCVAETFYLKNGDVVRGLIADENERKYKVTNGSVIDRNGYELFFKNYYLNKAEIIRKGEEGLTKELPEDMAIDSLEGLLQENQLEEADKLYFKALDLDAKGRYAEATEMLEKRLEILENIYGEDLIVRECLFKIGMLYIQQEKYAEAIPYYKRAIEIAKRLLSPDHLNIAYSLPDLASLYEETNQHSKAERLYKEALAIYEKEYAKDPKFGLQHMSPDMLNLLEKMIHFYERTGKVVEAQKLKERAKGIRLKNIQ